MYSTYERDELHNPSTEDIRKVFQEAYENGLEYAKTGKSGVGGGLVCAAKGPTGPMGIGLYGPALDVYGNSVAAVKAMEHISHLLHMHVFEY